MFIVLDGIGRGFQFDQGDDTSFDVEKKSRGLFLTFCSKCVGYLTSCWWGMRRFFGM